MGHFKNKKGESVKSVKFERNDKKAFADKPEFKKPKYVNVKLHIAYSDFYIDTLDSLYNLLSSITFDKVAVPVKMSKSDLGIVGKGSVAIGNIIKFNNDNSITISVSEENAKYITDKHVISAKCRKDYKTNEITYIIEFNITDKFISLDEHFKDLETAFIGDKEEPMDVEDITDED